MHEPPVSSEASRCGRAVLVAFAACCALAACERDRSPRATGSLVFSIEATGERTDLFLATEAEVVRSRTIRNVADDLGGRRRTGSDRLASDADWDRAKVTVARRGATTILDITVSAQDPRMAAELCNDIIAAYLQHRMDSKKMPILAQQQVLATELEALRGGPGADVLERELRELQVRGATQENDVRALEPCVMRRPAR